MTCRMCGTTGIDPTRIKHEKEQAQKCVCSSFFVRVLTNGEIKISPGTLYGSLSKMEKDGLIKFIKEEEKRKIYCITELGTQVLELEMKRIERLYKSMVEAK